MEPRFSVIIPAYNVAEYLEATLQSVWAQRVADVEVIVVNDGSTDATADVLARQTDARLKVMTTAHRGVSHARNTGIRQASGQYLAFLDGDDLWYSDHLEQAHAFFVQFPEVNWFAAGYVAGAELPERAESAAGDMEPAFRLLSFWRSGHTRTWTSCVVMKKSALLDVAAGGDLFPEELIQGEDTVAWMRFAERNPVLGCGSVTTAFYRMRAGSHCGSWRAVMEGVIDAESRFYETFQNMEIPAREDREYWRLRRYEIFAASFAGILRQASLRTLLPVLRVQYRSCGCVLALYMACVVCLFRFLSALFCFPLQVYIRLYRKVMRTWPR